MEANPIPINIIVIVPVSEGGQLLLLEAEPDPGLALLIPGDNYSSAIVRGVPGGLAEVGSTVVNTSFPLHAVLFM